MIKTIEDVKKCCKKNNIPLKDIKFFIDKNRSKEPYSYSLYKDTKNGDYVFVINEGDFIFERYRGDRERTACRLAIEKMYSVMYYGDEHYTPKLSKNKIFHGKINKSEEM